MADTVADSATSVGVKMFQSSPTKFTMIYWQNYVERLHIFIFIDHMGVRHSPLYYVLLVRFIKKIYCIESMSRLTNLRVSLFKSKKFHVLDEWK